jgi:hypothetical protein
MAGYTNKSGKKIWTLEDSDIEKAKDLGLDIMDIIPEGYDDYEIVDQKRSGGKVSRKRKGGSVSRKRGGKIMYGYKAGGKV